MKKADTCCPGSAAQFGEACISSGESWIAPKLLCVAVKQTNGTVAFNRDPEQVLLSKLFGFESEICVGERVWST
jgi:hypothetical protein